MDKKIGVILFVFVLLISCTPTEKTAEPIKIGGAFCLTGFGAGWGNTELKAVELAIEEHNEQAETPAKLIVEDIQSDGTKTVTAVTKLINVDNVIGIIGPTWLDTFAGAAPLTDNIVMITPSASITAIKSEKDFPNVFSTWYRTDYEAKALAEHLSEKELKNLVLAFGNDPFWQDFAANFKEAIEENDLTILEEYKFTAGDVDFRTPLIKIKKVAPDAILFGLDDEAGLFAFLKQRKELYPESRLYSTEMLKEFAVQEEHADNFENVFFISPSEASEEFMKKYKEKYGEEPVFSASNAYDATKILLSAIRDGEKSAEEIREHILNTEFDTVSFGKASFDSVGGIAGGKFSVYYGEEGKIKELK